MRRGTWLVMGLMAVAALGGCVTAEDVRRADGFRELGLSYLNEGKTEDALKELIAAKELNPRNARIRHELGLAFFAKGLFDRAEKELKVAIDLDPALAEAKLNLGSLYIESGRYDDAIPVLTEVTQDFLYRSPARAYNNLGWAYYQKGQLQKAREALEHAVRVAPLFCQGLYNLALVYEAQGELERLVSRLEMTVTRCSHDIRYVFKLGMTQAKLGETDKAFSYLEMVAEKDPWGTLGIEAREYLKTLR